jgi:hypothetical protein
LLVSSLYSIKHMRERERGRLSCLIYLIPNKRPHFKKTFQIEH